MLVVALAVGIAAALRWPNLWLIPTFTDETNEARLAVAIYRGQAAPLTNVDPYIGALWNYLLAAGFWLFGLSPWLPRLAAMLAGVATVGAAWWLGRELGGRVGGAVAAGFLATSSTHILVNSHVGWSHATTPLFATLGLACLARALRPEIQVRSSKFQEDRPGALNLELGTRGRWLVGAGLGLGLAVQTHATAALLLPGAALAVLLRRPALVTSRWAVLAIAAFLLVNANLVAYNVATGGRSFSGGLSHVAGYTGEEAGYDPNDYLANLGRLVLGGAWVLSGAIDKRRFVGESLTDPGPLLYLAVALGSVLWAARRGQLLPLLVGLPYVLVLPLVNPKYEPLLNGRYLVPLLPPIYASLGLLASDAWRALCEFKVPRSKFQVRGGPTLNFERGTLNWILAAGLVLLAAYPLVPLARYQGSTERTNRAVLAAHQAVLAHRQPDEVVLLDSGLDDVLSMAAGSAYKSMELLLGGSDVPYTEVDARASSIAEALADGAPRLLLLHGDKAAPLGRSFALTPLAPLGRGAGFGVYRVAPRG